jgi:O-antigen ligase
VAFLYPFLNFLQPGEYWPALAFLKPMLLASLVVGIASLRQGSRSPAPLLRGYFNNALLVSVIAFVIVEVISVYYSGLMAIANELSIWEVFPIYIAISLMTLRDVAALRRYIWGSMLGSAWVIFYGLMLIPLHSPRLQLDQGRIGAYGMYQNHNDYTFIIVMIFPFSVLYIRTCGRRWQKLLLMILATGCVAGAVLSLSRGGIIALALEGAILVWCMLRGKKRIVSVVAISVVGLVVSSHVFSVREETQGPLYTLADSEDSRYELWHAAIAVFKANPILGVGSNRFPEFAPEYASISHDNRGKVAHDTYLEVAADTGMLGLLTFGSMLWLTYRGIRGARFADATGDGLTETRVAGYVSFLAILFRALLDAKVYDWSFYFLAVIAIACPALAREAAKTKAAAVGREVADGREAAAVPVRSTIYRKLSTRSTTYGKRSR